jgi:beta-alanine degradation protein BauB
MAIARSEMCADDDRVRVTTLTFADGDETGGHRHEFDYVVVPVTGGLFEVTDRDGAVRRLEQMAGSPYRGRAGTDHNVVNRSGATAIFVEVELKR